MPQRWSARQIHGLSVPGWQWWNKNEGKNKAGVRMKSNYDTNTNVKNDPYLQDIVNVRHFLQNLPVSIRNRFLFIIFSKLSEQPKKPKMNWQKKKSRTHPTWSQPDTTHSWGICWRAASWGVLPLSWRILWHQRGQRWLNQPPSLTRCPYAPGSLAISCCNGWKKERNTARDKRDLTKRQ